MSRFDFTPMNEALNALAESINAAHSALTAKANAERVELMVLFAKMRETHEDFETFGTMMTSTAQTLGYAGASMIEYAKLIDATIEGGPDAIPECDYEEFVDFCDECGATITVNEPSFIDGDVALCKDCMPIAETNEEGEQLTIDETVEPAAVEG